jgi:hypothetical protein
VPKFIDISGQKYGKLTVLRRAGSICGKTTWLTYCECGSESEVTGLNLKSGNTKSCGCLKHRKGIANPKYRPIPLNIRRERKRAGAQHRNFRSDGLLRCPICIRCGAEHNLHVHHIKGSSEFPESRFDALNAITLCKPCHMEFHKRFGRRKGFNEEQLEGFVESPIAWLVARHQSNGGLEDLKKARHYIDLLIEWEYGR